MQTKVSAKQFVTIMKSILLVIVCLLPLSIFCQEVIKERWRIESGVSTNNFFKKSSILNLRYISPKFRLSDNDWTEEEERQPEKFKKARLMFELIHTPPLKVLCTGLNLQYRILKYKRVSLEIYGGFKFFFVAGPDFIMRPQYVKGTKKGVWYINDGLILQFDFGIISPFVDIGYDGMVTIGTELNFHNIYRKARKRYKLNTQSS
jgi:hypothetical protein